MLKFRQDLNTIKQPKIKGKKSTFTTQEMNIQSQIITLNTLQIKKRIDSDSSFNIIENDETAASDTLQAIQQKTDLIPNVYEGGLKTWECSLDLCLFLETIDFTNKKCLELGCGSGLPGITCLLKGALICDFQDYNENVINYVTAPNVVLNTNANLSTFIDTITITNDFKKSSFYSGDWGSLEFSDMYDVILTSETIYSFENYSCLLKLMKSCLKKDGIIYLAAKKIYFGCSGSLLLFKNACADHGFRWETVCVYNAGVDREILEIKLFT